MSRIILTIVFAVIVTPLGLVRRALGRDTLGRRFVPDAKSYRVESQPLPRERHRSGADEENVAAVLEDSTGQADRVGD